MRMKYPWVIGFGLLLPKPIPVYPMGRDFVPYPYPWGQFLSHTRTLIGEFPTGWRVSGPIDISNLDAGRMSEIGAWASSDLQFASG